MDLNQAMSIGNIMEESLSDSSSDNLDLEDDVQILSANLESRDNTKTYAMLHDIHQSLNVNRDDIFDHPMSTNTNEEPNKETKRLYNLLKDA